MEQRQRTTFNSRSSLWSRSFDHSFDRHASNSSFIYESSSLSFRFVRFSSFFNVEKFVFLIEEATSHFRKAFPDLVRINSERILPAFFRMCQLFITQRGIDKETTIFTYKSTQWKTFFLYFFRWKKRTKRKFFFSFPRKIGTIDLNRRWTENILKIKLKIVRFSINWPTWIDSDFFVRDGLLNDWLFFGRVWTKKIFDFFVKFFSKNFTRTRLVRSPGRFFVNNSSGIGCKTAAPVGSFRLGDERDSIWDLSKSIFKLRFVFIVKRSGVASSL